MAHILFYFNISIVVFFVLLRDNLYQIAVCLFSVKVRIKTFFSAGGENENPYLTDMIGFLIEILFWKDPQIRYGSGFCITKLSLSLYFSEDPTGFEQETSFAKPQ